MDSSGITPQLCFTEPLHGKPQRNISILLINPNSTPSMTAACVSTLASSLPQDCTVVGFTAPKPSASAIESAADAVLSSERCIRALREESETERFDAMLVACFSAHPLIPALRELYLCPVVGIMEASLYASRMLGGQFGIVATSHRSKLIQHDAVAGYGLSHFYAGSEATGLGVLELETKPREEVLERMGDASRRLVEERGADCVLLGCAGMTDMARACERAVGEEAENDNARTGGRERYVNVIDGVEIGVHFLVALVRARLATSKGGVYKSADESRKARGQDWL
jgi:Asp/Glu/hydantoin racemase